MGDKVGEGVGPDEVGAGGDASGVASFVQILQEDINDETGFPDVLKKRKYT